MKFSEKETGALINGILSRLQQMEKSSFHRAFIGIDGYLDRIIRPLKKQLKNDVVYFATISEFAEHCGRAAGKSAQIELVTQETKLGGNAPIFAFAMSALGTPVVCLGNFGAKQTHEVFKPLTRVCDTISLGDPAESIALEFEDGKLILSEISPFKKLTWNDVRTTVGAERLTAEMNSSSLIALVDWCNMINATEIWVGIKDEILPYLSGKERTFFFDLSDPSKKNPEEIHEAMKCISGFRPYGKVILGLNENESVKLFHALKDPSLKKPMSLNLEIICQEVYSMLDIDLLITHPTDCCLLTTKGGVIKIPGRVVSKPKISTGGGDNLNSGFCFGAIEGLSYEESAVLGMASSGAYVQNGKSPDIQAIIDYLNVWSNDLRK